VEDLLPRLAHSRLAQLADAFRVVVINGPRQAGKTTLLQIFHEQRGGDLMSLDDPTQLSGALDDPRSLALDAVRPTLIDEVQRGGDPLVLAIKYAVDRDRSRGPCCGRATRHWAGWWRPSSSLS
jgi:predicted AAA+ superfamily ATPase